MMSVKSMGGVVHPLSAKARVTAVLRAYFDESGTHADPEVFVLAGYVAPEYEWDKVFVPKWSAILAKPRINPPLPYFQASKLEGQGSGIFRNITGEERRQLKTDAANVVISSGLMAFCSAVIMKSYKKYVVGKVKKVIGDQYQLCFQHVIIEMAERAKAFIDEDPTERIAFVFDQHPWWGPKAHVLYDKMIAVYGRDRYRLGSLAFDDKKGFAPLQAADHLAYETYRYRTDRGAVRPVMNRFLTWPQHRGKIFNDSAFESLIGEFKKSGKL